jgi:hypothetical protein
MAVIAIGIAIRNVRRDTEILRAQIPGLLSVARELEVDDPTRFAVVARLPEWFAEMIWDLHVPEGATFELCLAMDQIAQDGLAEPVKCVQIDSGRRKIEFKYETRPDDSIASVLVDDEVVIRERRPKDWEPRVGSSGSSSISHSDQHDAAKPLVLFRRRFMVRVTKGNSTTPKVPTQGILIWIEPK